MNAQAQDKGVDDYNKGMKIYVKDHDKAMPWFKKAAKEGNADGMLMLGKLYANDRSEFSHDYANAVKWYQAAAALGNTTAMNSLGYLYEKGIVGYINNGDGNTKIQDIELAKVWYQKAADMGDSNGMYSMAQLYLNVDRSINDNDRAKAVQWYKKAAALGNTKAMLALGFYLLSKKNPHDEEQGV
jgi:TPR repeat protein